MSTIIELIRQFEKFKNVQSIIENVRNDETKKGQLYETLWDI